MYIFLYRQRGWRLSHPSLPPQVRMIVHHSMKVPDWQSPSHSLAFKVEVADSLDKKLDRLIPFLKSRTGPAIVYVTLQKHAEAVANHLRPHNLEPMVYHAGLPHEQRAKVQMEFMNSAKGIVCATIAFGMGIDKGTHDVN
jgi:superfamily II DNA helicase RecQ